MTEIQALKTEISQAILRKLQDDSRTPAELFGVASTAVTETLADLIFSVAKDEAHGTELLGLTLAIVWSRWAVLAKEHSQRENRDVVRP